MNPNALKPNVQDLQTDVIKLLKDVSKLMKRASEALSSDGSGDKYLEFQQEVEDATQNVKDLELRMAIVAPMKAGKSTIINAIVGQELLPSRNAAMTTLPTEIILDKEINEPTLKLTSEIISVFQEAYLALQQKIQSLEEQSRLQEKLGQYPHLLELVQEVKETIGFPVQTKTTGRKEIIEALTGLNDIVRLCSILDPTKDPISRITTVPSIITPFLSSQGDKQLDQLGNLVIVDTPGPNEAGENLRLTAVVAEELRKSSIVLIVLDFTQLNNKAAEEVKKQVQPIIELIGKENLYVVINKVDQRRRGDMTPEQVKDFVFADLELSRSRDTAQVYELSAIQAFSATKFLSELQQNPDVEIHQMQTVETLAQEALGARWETKLKRTSIEELQEEANYLWEDSGFAPFLDNAIAALIASAAPRTMKSALNLSRSRLQELRDSLNLRSSAIAKDEKKLRLEIEALEADLKRLDLCRDRLLEIEKIRTSLQNNLNEILEILKQESQISIKDYFIEEDHDRGDTLKKWDIRARELFLTNISNIEVFPKWISRKIKSKIEYKPSGIVEFTTQSEAEDFANQAVAWAKQRSENLLVAVRQDSEKEIEKARKGLMNFLKEQTEEIIEKARKRLNESFNVDLAPPPINLEKQESIKSVEAKVTPETKDITDYQTEKYRPWYFLWLFEKERQISVTRQETYYTVALEDLVSKINLSIEENVDNINNAITLYLDQDFQQRIDNYFESLDGYLRNYRDSLRQAQEDQKQDAEAKKKLIDSLTSLVPDANNKIQECEKNLKHINDLL